MQHSFFPIFRRFVTLIYDIRAADFAALKIGDSLDRHPVLT